MEAAQTRGGARGRHVACCVDGAPGDAAAVVVGRALAGPDGRLSVLHVAGRSPTGAGEGVGDGETRARRLVEAAAQDVAADERLILRGAPGPAICRWAEVAGADILVVTSRHPGRWGMSVLGPVIRHVVDHAPCPVLVVRHGEG
ncbi:MAG TPA: universal stress protein [Miltoncostaeaceae bacterium]|nr:universal stress protein [Miltoncostaeaceae bacterium]